MHLTIVGAGAVGLVLGARAARSGADVLFVVRRPEVADAILREGVGIEDPASGACWRTPARAVLGFEAASSELLRGPVLICVRSNDTGTAADAIARCAPEACVVSAQNDVDNEAKLARRFRHVSGMVVRQTCTVARENLALASGKGRLVLGLHPGGTDERVHALAGLFAGAGFDVGVSSRIGEDKWLKLCVNLLSSANALIRKPDHEGHAFVEIKARLLEETRAVLAAEGIEARSCDGRDRSLDEEIVAQRRALELGTSSRSLPLYNAVWSALRDPDKPLEADLYHRRIIELASRHALPTPLHRTLLHALLRAVSEGLGPECFAADELLESAEAG